MSTHLEITNNNKSFHNEPHPAIVESVESGSIGEELGFEPGDTLIKINGVRPRDLIDYRFLTSEEELNLEVIDKKGEEFSVKIEKDTDQNLGLIFTEALFDGLKQCNNNCPFCFIDQQPKGKRKTLYLKDDDYRMSFLYGSYLTLTNLSENDWERINKQRLSPLFVSVHATDPNLRSRLLRNSKAKLLMNQLKWFSKHNIQIHAQIVICPDMNDGKVLENSLIDLFQYGKGEWPTVISAAIVPVGLTRFRPNNDNLKPVDESCANQTIDQVENLQNFFKENSGSRFAWLSDEWYLIAKRPLPDRRTYEDLPQKENGVGSIRSFLESIDKATHQLPKKISLNRNCSWVVGRLVEHALKDACSRLNEVKNLKVNLIGLPSPYWGQDQVVTGLLTGQDLIKGLTNQKLGEELLLPSIMLQHDQSMFLDDMTIQEVSNALNIPIKVVHGPEEIVAAALGQKPNVF